MGQAVIDPVSGRSLGREELAEKLDPFRRRSGLVDEFEVPLGLYLQAAPPREIIARMLRNLKEIYRTQEDWERMLAIQERLVVLLPDSWPEYRDRPEFAKMKAYVESVGGLVETKILTEASILAIDD
jgi:regulator of sirC expression with transglutaminase-like and TPR domain